jgi:hypothetical protein
MIGELVRLCRDSLQPRRQSTQNHGDRMSETAAAYTTRILGYLGDSDALATLEATPATLVGLVTNVDDARLGRKPAPDKWSIQEILAHLADAELVMGYRLRRVLDTNGVAIDAFDQERWAEVGRYEQARPRDSLSRIQAERAANVRLLRGLRPEEMEQYGIHSQRGKETIRHMSRMWAGHDLNHRRQIEAILGA